MYTMATSKILFLGTLGLVAIPLLAIPTSRGVIASSSPDALTVCDQETPSWMSLPAVRAILKQGDVVGVSHTQGYRFEGGVPKRVGIDVLTFTLSTKTIGRTSIHLNVFSDRELMKETKDIEAQDARENPAEEMAKIRKSLKDLDSAPDRDWIDITKWQVEMNINSLWSRLNGGATLAWIGDSLVRSGSQTSVQDTDPLMLAGFIGSGNEILVGNLSDKLTEMKGQLRRSTKRYDDAMQEQADQLRKNGRGVRGVPLEVLREYHASRGEFAVQFLEDYMSFQRQLASALKRQ